MATETADADEWETEYSDRFAYKRRRGQDTIKVKQPQDIDGARDHYEVVARLGDDVYHTTHAEENEAMERVMVLEGLCDYEVTFETGEHVYVVDDSFESVVQEGHIGFNVGMYDSIPVFVDTDPYDADEQEGRVIRVQREQIIHADADTVETLVFIGRIDLLEPEDFE
jgi:hypothetical protein